MLKKSLSILLSFLVFLTLSLRSEDLKQIIKTADSYYQQRGDVQNARLAFKEYKLILQLEPDHYEALWKAAKSAFYLCEALASKKEKKIIVKEGVRFAKNAVKVKPNEVEGHFWLGVLHTKYGELYGVLKALFLIKPAKREMRKVLKLDDSYELGGAYVVLGRIYSQVPGLFGGSNKKARAHFEKVKQRFPGNSLNLFFMAETYWDLKDRKKAIQTLEELLKMEADPNFIPETKRYQVAGKELLLKYKKKIKK